MIDDFRGEYRWLSNFEYARITYQGREWPTNEHAYQAAKTIDLVERDRIMACGTPGGARREGGNVTLHGDWDSRRYGVMLALTRIKFLTHTKLAEKLLATGQQELVEGNTWNDRYWGVCHGSGENNLGKILMQVRDEIWELYPELVPRIIAVAAEPVVARVLR